MARNIISMAPEPVRLGYVRKLEKERRRAAFQIPPMQTPVTGPLTIEPPPAPKLSYHEKLALRQAQDAVRKAEAARLGAQILLDPAARAFISAIESVDHELSRIVSRGAVEEELEEGGTIRVTSKNTLWETTVFLEGHTVVMSAPPSHFFIEGVGNELRTFVATLKKHPQFLATKYAVEARAMFARYWRKYRDMSVGWGRLPDDPYRREFFLRRFLTP